MKLDEGGGQCKNAMNDTDIAYIAGLFDGEGCSIIQNNICKKAKGMVSLSLTTGKLTGNCYDRKIYLSLVV